MKSSILLLTLIVQGSLSRTIITDDNLVNELDLDGFNSDYPEQLNERDDGGGLYNDRIVFPSDKEWDIEFLSNLQSFDIDPRFGRITTPATTIKQRKGNGNRIPETTDFLKWLQVNPNRNPIKTDSMRQNSGKVDGDDYCLTCGTRLKCNPPDIESPSGQCVPRVNI